MPTLDDAVKQFNPTGEATVVAIDLYPGMIADLKSAFKAKTNKDLDAAFSYAAFKVSPYGAPDTYQVGFAPKKGGQIFWSDLQLWTAGMPFYTITNELAGIA